MMEDLRNEGKTRSIGVSNYRVADLEETLKNTKVSGLDWINGADGLIECVYILSGDSFCQPGMSTNS
jgi:aryl-alcohol dehydrogenase-like predicted oxidoreductase